MPTFRPGVDDDDAYWDATPPEANLVQVDSTILIGNMADTDRPVDAFVRFVNVTIPRNAKITSAFLRVTGRATGGDPTVNATISANPADNPSAPATVAAAAAIGNTSATVAWNAIAATTAGVSFDSPDIKSIIQEIINRAGWESGNALMIMVRDNGSTSGAPEAVRWVNSFQEFNGAMPALVVEYLLTGRYAPLGGKSSSGLVAARSS